MGRRCAIRCSKRRTERKHNGGGEQRSKGQGVFLMMPNRNGKEWKEQEGGWGE